MFEVEMFPSYYLSVIQRNPHLFPNAIIRKNPKCKPSILFVKQIKNKKVGIVTLLSSINQPSTEKER